jgi:hypothetical protein
MINQHFQFQRPLKYTQIENFGMQIYHLATLVVFDERFNELAPASSCDGLSMIFSALTNWPQRRRGCDVLSIMFLMNRTDLRASRVNNTKTCSHVGPILRFYQSFPQTFGEKIGVFTRNTDSLC